MGEVNIELEIQQAANEALTTASESGTLNWNELSLISGAMGHSFATQYAEIPDHISEDAYERQLEHHSEYFADRIWEEAHVQLGLEERRDRRDLLTQGLDWLATTTGLKEEGPEFKPTHGLTCDATNPEQGLPTCTRER
ncbi:MAG: hypothetical protein CMM94_07815 [Rickettsiales bacterium]|nr:hypothetical protein [Rickettsiales bacterium]